MAGRGHPPPGVLRPRRARGAALPPAGTQPAESGAPLQMGQGDPGGQTSQLSDQRGLQVLITRQGEGWAPVVSVLWIRKRPIQGTRAARETPPPGPRPGSEALPGLGGRGHTAIPAARPWVSLCPHGRGVCLTSPPGAGRPHGGNESAYPPPLAVGHLRAALGMARCGFSGTLSVRTHVQGVEGLGGQGLESPGELESAVQGPRASHLQLQGSHPRVQGQVPSRLPGPRFRDAGGGLGGSGGTKEQLPGCSGSEPGIRRLLPPSQPQPQSWRLQ